MDKLYASTIEALEQSLHRSMIASPIDFEDGVFLVEALDSEIVGFARAHHFSQVPLREPNSGHKICPSQVAIIGIQPWRVVERRPVQTSDLIAGSTPVAAVIKLLCNRAFFFLLETDQITSILTRADLNGLPVRTYLHTLLDHFEYVLGAELSRLCQEDSWLDLLPKKNQDRIRSLHILKAAEDFDSNLIDCATLSEKINVLLKIGDEILPATIFESKKRMKKSLGRIRVLRDRIDHGAGSFFLDVDRLRNQVRHCDQVTKLKDINWLSSVVDEIRRWISILEHP